MRSDDRSPIKTSRPSLAPTTLARCRDCSCCSPHRASKPVNPLERIPRQLSPPPTALFLLPHLTPSLSSRPPCPRPPTPHATTTSSTSRVRRPQSQAEVRLPPSLSPPLLPAPSLTIGSPPAAQGIGAAVGLRFAQAGANVYVIGRNEKLGEDVVRRCRAQAGAAADGRTFEFIKADLSCVPRLAPTSSEVLELTCARATGP